MTPNPAYGDVRGDGYIFTGILVKAGRAYQQWRSPESFAKRQVKSRERQKVGNMPPEKAEQFRRRNAQKNARRRESKRDHINELRKKAYTFCKNVILSRNRSWRKENWSKVLQSRRKPQYAIASKLRVRVLRAVKDQRAKKSAPTETLIGCSIDQLIAHLESHFKEGMNWGNHGRWHIDHIKPCSSYDLALPTQQRECFHYTNLQPLWDIENLRKGSKLPTPFQPAK